MMALQNYLKQDNDELSNSLEQLFKEAAEHMKSVCENKTTAKTRLTKAEHARQLEIVDKTVHEAIVHKLLVTKWSNYPNINKEEVVKHT